MEDNELGQDSFEEQDSLADALQSSQDDQSNLSQSQKYDEPYQAEPQFKGPEVEFREDQLNLPRHDCKLVVDSEIVMSPNETEKTLVQKSGDAIFYANKLDRERMMDQFINQIRWRFADNEKLIQSNSRLVEWDDGTFGIYIGSDYYDISPSEPEAERQKKLVERTNIYLSENNVMINQGGIVEHGGLHSKSNYSGQIKLY